jgi:hypothetical protein
MQPTRQVVANECLGPLCRNMAHTIFRQKQLPRRSFQSQAVAEPKKKKATTVEVVRSSPGCRQQGNAITLEAWSTWYSIRVVRSSPG